jgi:hypothetical protein
VLIARLIAELKRYEERLRARLQGAGA